MFKKGEKVFLKGTVHEALDNNMYVVKMELGYPEKKPTFLAEEQFLVKVPEYAETGSDVTGGEVTIHGQKLTAEEVELFIRLYEGTLAQVEYLKEILRKGGK